MVQVDMDVYAATHSTHAKGTADNYESKLRKFDEMMGLKEGEQRTAEMFTDANQAKFLATLSETFAFHPSALKTGSAALGKMALEFKLPNVRQNPALFPEVQLVLRRWLKYLKDHPHWAQGASRWSHEATFFLGTMESETLIGIFIIFWFLCFFN